VLLLSLRDDFGPVDPEDKDRRRELKDAADRASHLLIMERLLAARPDDAILSEEGVDITARDDAGRVWIVDPLDGTSEYGQGRSDFAVHIALWGRAATSPSQLTVGVVDLPAQGLTRSTTDEVAELPPFPRDRPLRFVVSRSRPPAMTVSGLEALSQQLSDAGLTDQGVEVINVGSVGAKVAEVLAGRADAYLHDSGFYEWDVAAPLAVAHHYGLTAMHIDGSAITFNHRPPWVTDLVVSLPALGPFVAG
jgi:3'(2'), 5'-bisphosphate nucleotidase